MNKNTKNCTDCGKTLWPQNKSGRCITCDNRYRSIQHYNQLTQDEKKRWWERRERAHICSIIKKHHEDMKDDPEHLTTEFIQNIIGVKCK